MKFIRFFVNQAPEQQSDINTIIHVTGSYSPPQLKQQCLFKMLKTT